MLSRRKKEKAYSTKDSMSKTKFHVTFGSREVGIIQKQPIIIEPQNFYSRRALLIHIVYEAFSGQKSPLKTHRNKMY